MASNLKPFLNFYDAFGWIPTIRGALSLDLMGNKNKIWGDVDRYAVEFINYRDLSSERFIAATSLHNVSDSKYGEDYVRTFRYFFYATIHNEEDGQKFIDSIKNEVKDEQDKENINTIIDKEGVLLGHLVIVIEDTTRLTDREVRIIKDIKNLQRCKNSYNFQFSVMADSLDELENKRIAMKRIWMNIKNEIEKLKDDDKRQFDFDVLLTRDGILLLKDCTAKEFRDIYFSEGTASDYTLNIPIHRIFKTAMNFMKYLFHTNYHHEEEHDTFLPASNLHLFQKSSNFNAIFKHQLNAFLNPLMKLRRNGLKQFSVDPIGIMHYAKSFVYACQNNSLVTSEEAKQQLDYISLLEAETNHSSRHNKSLLSSLATQRNSFFIISTILAFTVAVLKIFESGVKLSGTEENIYGALPWYWIIIGFGFVCIFGYSLFEWSFHSISKREFHLNKFKLNKNKLRNRIFNRDSDLNNGELSKNLRLYILIQDNWYKLLKGDKRSREGKSPNGKLWIIIAKMLFWLICLVTLILIIIRLL